MEGIPNLAVMQLCQLIKHFRETIQSEETLNLQIHTRVKLVAIINMKTCRNKSLPEDRRL